MSKEIFVAFATQKGGIGKSTVTALAASYLHNVKGYNVAVVDCDDPQHSIHGLREHEMGLIDSSTYFKALACDHFRRIKKNAYTIVKSNAVTRNTASTGCVNVRNSSLARATISRPSRATTSAKSGRTPIR